MSDPSDETRTGLPAVPPPPPPPAPKRLTDETRADLPAYSYYQPPPGYLPPSQNYYPPLPPPPSPQLPDFKPHRMALLDKVLAWLVVFILLVFGIILAAHFLLKPVTPGTPSPRTSSSSHATVKAKTKAAVCPPSST